jgi:hypothetical protein
MLLCEEYLKRHKIKIPLVQYRKNGCLFIRESSDWLALLVHWDGYLDERHPGRFLIRFVRPNHNGISAAAFRLAVPECTFYWDEYEDFILALSEKLPKVQIVYSKKIVVLTAWEMFLYCCDGCLSETMNLDKLYAVIDIDRSLEERYSSFLIAISEVQQYCNEAYRFWQQHIGPCVRNYSYWLADLVRKNNRDHIKEK